MLNAFNQLRKKYNNLSLTIVANSGSIPKNIMESIKRMRQINFIEETTDKSMIEKLYLNSDIFVLPPHFEGYGLSIVEAMSFGLPIISTKIGSIPEMVMNEKNGFLISDNSIDELAKKMEFFIENPEYVRIYGKMSFKIFEEKFSIKNRNESIKKVYLKAINENGK